ncbi:hypothetical protein L1049_024829 [Liquidambar formosana]|uniref:F-box protein n=1 Tax=Liquidambar formosana TaxID=63359 RepID=A0AAP0S1M7_LIQFO
MRSFGEMMLPTSLVHVFGVSIAVYGESLVLLHYDVHLFDCCCCIWMMKEYGVVESWTKQFRIDIQAQLVNTVGLRKNAEILLAMNDGDLVSYHPKTQRVKDLGIHGDTLHVSNSLYVGTYVESLVLLKGVNGVLGGLEESSDAVPCTSLLGGNDEVEKTATVEGNDD